MKDHANLNLDSMSKAFGAIQVMLLLLLTLVAGVESSYLDCRLATHLLHNPEETCTGRISGRSDAYEELRLMLEDAVVREERQEFVVHTLMEIVKYTYPCASDAEAALYAFADPTHHLRPSAEWLEKWNPYFVHHQTFAAEDAKILHDLFQRIGRETNYNCLLQLYSYFLQHGGTAAFGALYGDFLPLPTTPVPTTSAPTSPVPTTPVPTTSAPTTHAPTTQAPTTLAPTTHFGISCTVCSDLECLLHVHVQNCSSHQQSCFIKIHDNGVERNVTRGCIESTSCESPNMNPALCQEVEKQLSTVDTTCLFCCQTDDCNKPPFLIPVSSH